MTTVAPAIATNTGCPAYAWCELQHAPSANLDEQNTHIRDLIIGGWPDGSPRIMRAHYHEDDGLTFGMEFAFPGELHVAAERIGAYIHAEIEALHRAAEVLREFITEFTGEPEPTPAPLAWAPEVTEYGTYREIGFRDAAGRLLGSAWQSAGEGFWRGDYPAAATEIPDRQTAAKENAAARLSVQIGLCVLHMNGASLSGAEER